MAEKLLTVGEFIKELEKLSDNDVIKVRYDRWLHNNPAGEIELVLSIEDAEKMCGGSIYGLSESNL